MPNPSKLSSLDRRTSSALESYFISDMNEDLVLQVEELIERLDELQRHYLQMAPERRKEFFYDVRRQFNLCQYQKRRFRADSGRRARLIFLNRTCFNG